MRVAFSLCFFIGVFLLLTALVRHQIDRERPAGDLLRLLGRIKVVQLVVVVQLEFLCAGKGQGGQLPDGDLKALRPGAVAEGLCVERAHAPLPADGAAVGAEDLRPHRRAQRQRIQLRGLPAADRVVIQRDRARLVCKVIVLVQPVPCAAGAADERVPDALGLIQRAAVGAAVQQPVETDGSVLLRIEPGLVRGGVVVKLASDQPVQLLVRQRRELLRPQHAPDGEADVRAKPLFAPFRVGVIGAVDPHEHERGLQPPVQRGAAFRDGIRAPVRREAALRENDDGIAPADRPQDPDGSGQVAGEELLRQDAAAPGQPLEERPGAVVFVDEIAGLARMRHLRDVIKILKGFVVGQQHIGRLDLPQRRVVDLDALPPAEPEPHEKKDEGVVQRVRRPVGARKADAPEKNGEQRAQQRGQREDRRQPQPRRDRDVFQNDGEEKQDQRRDRRNGDRLPSAGARRIYSVHGIPPAV